MSRIVVTGAAGFIGSHLCEALLAIGHYVTGIDNMSAGNRGNLKEVLGNERFRLLEVDCCDVLESGDCDFEFDYVYHCAAVGSVPLSIAEPYRTFENNVLATHTILEWCVQQKAQALFFTSSSSVYGDNHGKRKKVETMDCFPTNPYAMSKLACELYLQTWERCYGLRTHSFRLFNVFGPRQNDKSRYAAITPLVMNCLKNNRPLTLFNAGNNLRDFTFVDDVVNVLINAPGYAKRPVYNVCTGSSILTRNHVETLCKAAGRDLKLEMGPHRPGDIKTSSAATEWLDVDFHCRVPKRYLEQYVRTAQFYLGEVGDA